MAHRTWIAALALTAALSCGAKANAASTWCASGKPIRIAAITWKSGQFYGELIRAVLEGGYGCRIEMVEGSTDQTEAALVQGELHVWPEQWGGKSAIFQKGMAEGRVKLIGNLLEGGTLEGWFVPEFVIKGDARRGIKALAPDLKSVTDLPRYRQLFVQEGNPDKGLFLSCPVGWACEKDNHRKFKAYRLDDVYTNYRPSSGAVLDMLIAAAMAVDKPVLFYYWSPAALMGGQYRFVQLEEPAYDATCWKTIHDETGDKPCGSATPPTTLSIGVAAALVQADPDIVAFLAKLQLTPRQLNGVVFRMTEKRASALFEAQEFLRKNPALLRTWVPEAVAAKLQAALQAR